MNLHVNASLAATIIVALLTDHVFCQVSLQYELTDNGIKVKALRDNEEKVAGILGVKRNFTSVKCFGMDSCQIDDYIISVNRFSDGFKITWETNNTDVEFQDCWYLEEGVHWFGGPERRVQTWPIERMSINGKEPYVIKRNDNFGVAERYWLNSKGASIYLWEEVPLFVDQNVENENQVCFIAKLEAPYINRTRNILEYGIVLNNDAKEAHTTAVLNFLGKPTGYPDFKMISEPIWTSWAKYKTDIDDKTILAFAQDIRDHGYVGGQLEIDDNWETCYGSQEFSTTKFPDIVNTVKELKNMNFRVTLWIHPFVNSDCQNNSNVGIEKGYFVKNLNGAINGSWWRGTDAYQIDFTNAEAAKWFSSRLEALRNKTGIDSFKFDAGETDYAPQPSEYSNVDQETIPNGLSSSYIRTCSEFGRLIEVRSAWRTQDVPIFVRMLDKDSNWGLDNGLPTLVTTLLQMNMNGYGMVLPDMIGGNGYAGETPSAELLVRWTQATVFMPAMQFSYLPWEINSTKFDAAALVQKFYNLHYTNAELIKSAMEESIRSGRPVNPPIWWIDPTDPKALACNDEYLLGEDILAAPVLVEGAVSRDVYLPNGTWKDGNTGTIYNGPINLVNYEAQIETLPYFIKVA